MYVPVCMHKYKYNLLSLFVLFVYIWFQDWPLCIGQTVKGLSLGEANSPSSSR